MGQCVDQCASTATGHSALQSRHVTMIALGGIIGAGLFIGSASIIHATGPASVLSYGIAGLLVYLVMRALAELAIAHPHISIFTEYTRDPLGNNAAFTAGWLYAYFWIIVVGIETIAGAATLQRWIDMPVWAGGGLLLLGVTIANLNAVRVFGEVEFWFASIKVAAIVGFIAIGIGYLVFGPTPSPAEGSALFAGKFVPFGWSAVAAAVPMAMFATGGAEIATVAAADSDDPVRNVTRTTKNVIFRVLAFYVSSLVVVVAIVPFDRIVPGFSPFVTTLDIVGIPYAASAINFVVFTAILSCLNSGVYVTSRILFGMAQRGDAPASMAVLGSHQVPRRAVLFTSACGLVITALSILSYTELLDTLISASGAIMMYVYLLIALAHLAYRRQLRKDARTAGGFPVHPAFSLTALVLILGCLGLLAMDPGGRPQVLGSLAVAVLISLVHLVRKLVRPGAAQEAGSPAV